MVAPFAIDRFDSAIALLELYDDGAADQVDLLAQQRLVQQIEQARAMDAQAAAGGIKILVMEIEHAPASDGAAIDAAHLGPGFDGGLIETQLLQDREAAGLQQQASAYRRRLQEAFEDCNLVAVVGEEQGGGLSRNAAADDCNMQCPHD